MHIIINKNGENKSITKKNHDPHTGILDNVINPNIHIYLGLHIYRCTIFNFI